MKFSVITVCYNCEEFIEKTMDSLLQQDCADYEYIIVDGGSKDATFRLVQQSKERFKRITALSEPDKGIYDAMNKAVKLAKGEYVYFLNAGDRFMNCHVLSRVAERMDTEPNADVYYGTMLRGGKIETFPARVTLFHLIYLERMICHQAMFIKQTLMEQYPYDIQFPICADREWMIRMVRKGTSCVYMPEICVGEYDTTGVSSQYDRFSGDSKRVAVHHGGTAAGAFVEIKRFVGSFLKRMLRK